MSQKPHKKVNLKNIVLHLLIGNKSILSSDSNYKMNLF